jgi:hypothetical protein
VTGPTATPGSAGIGRAELRAIGAQFAQQLAAPVAIDVWTRTHSALVRTDRDPCTHCPEVLAAARQLAALHPGLSLTLYDLDRHASRAEPAAQELAPLTVLRGSHGRELRIHGLWSGLLFASVVDAIIMLGSSDTPVLPADRDRLRAALEPLPPGSVELEVLGVPYDPFSAHMLRLCAALATETPRLRPRFIEVVEFPRLAAARAVHQLPVSYVGPRGGAAQRFVGVWDDPELVEQLIRTAAGDATPVERAQPLTTPLYNEEELAQLAAAQAAEAQPAEPTAEPAPRRAPGGFEARPSGLYLPTD